ncbi:MAG: FlgK family flagellar hook-associated protein, partial [Acidimicrobiales bacterium]
MDQGLSIAISGLNASMAQIDATTQNIANSQTPGYVTESATLAALPGGGTVDVGGGVQVTSIAQANDLLLSANNLQAQGALSNLGALQQVLTGIESVFPLGQNSSASTTQSANTSIAGQLSNFWSAWDAVAQDPSSLAPRTQIVDMAQGLATSLNEAATQLGQLATNTASQL